MTMFVKNLTTAEELEARMLLDDDGRQFWIIDDESTTICGYVRMQNWTSYDGEDLSKCLLKVGTSSYALVCLSHRPQETSRPYFVQAEGTEPYNLTHEEYKDLSANRKALRFEKFDSQKAIMNIEIISAMFIGDSRLPVLYLQNVLS